MLKTLTLTPELCAAIYHCRRAEALYVPGQMAASVVELPRLELADVVLASVAEQGVAVWPPTFQKKGKG